jgi:hypothetical protein
MGFHRQGQPAALDRAGLTAVVARFVAEELDLLTCTPADPFGVDNSCPFSPSGHDYIAACGDVVCCHCGKVVWS